MDKLEYIPGDLVMTKTEPNDFTPNGVVCEFVSYCNRNKVFVRVAKGIDTFFLEKEQITPIPLTPEILEKNGWEFAECHKDEDGFEWYIFSKDGILPDLYYYPADKDFSVFICGEETLPDVKWVHQLQHILFGLGINHEMEV